MESPYIWHHPWSIFGRTVVDRSLFVFPVEIQIAHEKANEDVEESGDHHEGGRGGV